MGALSYLDSNTGKYKLVPVGGGAGGSNIYSEDEIVMLAETENLDSGEVVLSLTDGVKSKPVLKIMKHLFQTSDEAYVYELDAEGKPVFEKEGVSISVSSAVESKPSAEPKVLAEPKSKSKSKSKSEPKSEVLDEPSTEADSE